MREGKRLSEFLSFRLFYHGRLLPLRGAACSKAALQQLVALGTAVRGLLDRHLDTKEFVRMVSKWNTLFAPNKDFRVDVPLPSNGFLKGVEICDLLRRRYGAFRASFDAYHLAELPGGFYWAFQHFGERCGVKVNARIQSLGSGLGDMTNSFEGLIDYGPHDGDLMKEESVRWYIENIGKKDIITADGGLDYFERQQLDSMLRLYYGEARIAVHCLRPAGVFVLKVYVVFDPKFFDFVYFLYRNFKRVAFFKPMYSKAHSFELYLVCAEPLRRKRSRELHCACLTQLAAALAVTTRRIFAVYRLYGYVHHYPHAITPADRARCRSIDQTRRYFLQKMLKSCTPE